MKSKLTHEPLRRTDGRLFVHWDLPPYKSAAFMAILEDTGMTLEQFREGFAYQSAVGAGWIVDDEWNYEAAPQEVNERTL